MKIALLPGDGIGQEIVPQALKCIDAMRAAGLNIETETALIGGSAIDSEGAPLPSSTLEVATEADAVLMGSVGGAEWEGLPLHRRPEKGLLELRKRLDLFANLRPAVLFPKLMDASTLKKEVVENLDLLIVRELTGGIYFGEPRGVEIIAGKRRGFNTYVYTEDEIRRIARVALQLAQQRRGQLCSVDKANVLEVTGLWRAVMTETAREFSDVSLSHMHVDNAAMQLIRNPGQFDVIVTGNMFGDILSDEAAMLTGSIGMLPSASLNDQGFGLYEPVHGSAPDIAGQDKANPLATILSLAMAMRHTFGLPDIADHIEQAVEMTLEEGVHTPDIVMPGGHCVGTMEMGSFVAATLSRLLSNS